MVLKQVITLVNIVKASVLSTRLFECLCEKMGSIRGNLLYYMEVQWLLRKRDRSGL